MRRMLKRTEYTTATMAEKLGKSREWVIKQDNYDIDGYLERLYDEMAINLNDLL